MQHTSGPLADIVLVGGGHSHVQVLRASGMRPFEGARLTLVNAGPHAVYSGMVPGVVSGQYTLDEVVIDLRPLARRVGARFIDARATTIDPERRVVELEGRPPLSFDLCSINVGSTVAGLEVPGVRQFAIPTRPIDQLVNHWERRLSSLSGTIHVVVVGGGAGGVELAFCARQRLLAEGHQPRVSLVTRDQRLLARRPARLHARLAAAASRRGIEVRTGIEVLEVHADHVQTSAGPLPADAVFWATGAAAPALPTASGWPTDSRGFARVTDELRHPSVQGLFAVGDCAVPTSTPAIPKAGVYAVRQGPVLIENLRRSLRGHPLRNYHAQSDFFTLLNLGDGTAIGAKWGLHIEGRAAFRWKDHIDRAFMDKFQVLDGYGHPRQAFARDLPQMVDEEMYCGGCAAKVGPRELEAALAALPPSPDDPDVIAGVSERADNAITAHGGEWLVQNLDAFTAFTDDPWWVGRIAALNALSDLVVAGATPRWALATVTIPRDARADTTLEAVLRGLRSALDPQSVVLTGGHTTLGDQLEVGLSITGTAPATPFEPPREGSSLVLTRPLGAGVLWRADAQGLATGAWMKAMSWRMDQGNHEAANIARSGGASVLTDVTGFGLAGHLVAWCRRHGRRATLDLDQLPALPGVLDLVARDMRSTAHDANRSVLDALAVTDDLYAHPAFELLFDPQTAGGLLIACSPEATAALVEHLKALDPEVRVIGQLGAANTSTRYVEVQGKISP